jgi:hypothetical protein
VSTFILVALSALLPVLTLSGAATPSVCLFACAAGIAFALSASLSDADRWNPLAIFVAVSAAYALAAIVEIALLGNNLNLEEPLMVRLTSASALFLAVTVGGSVAIRTVAPPRPLSDIRPDDIRSNQALLYCTVLLAVVFGMTVYWYGFGIGAISRADLYVDEKISLSLARSTLAVSFGIAASYLQALEPNSPSKRSAEWRLYVLLTLYFLNDLLILGDRRLPLAAVLSVAAVTRPGLTLRRVAGALLLGVALLFYGFVRNTPVSSWVATLGTVNFSQALSPAAHEFGGIAIIGSTIGDERTLPSTFPPYSDAFLQVIPRALSPNRPESAGEWFAWTYYPEVARTGAGFAFNAVIEALANGGFLALVGVALLWGAAITFVSSWRWRGIAVGVPLSAYMFVFSMRMDFASLLRTCALAVASLVLMQACVGLLATPGRKRDRIGKTTITSP